MNKQWHSKVLDELDRNGLCCCPGAMPPPTLHPKCYRRQIEAQIPKPTLKHTNMMMTRETHTHTRRARHTRCILLCTFYKIREGDPSNMAEVMFTCILVLIECSLCDLCLDLGTGSDLCVFPCLSCSCYNTKSY